jgi:hypothetical protein
MGEEEVRQNIRKLLIESLDEVHLTLSGKYVPIDSKECYRDLLSRIADAEAQRNCCDRGTAARMHYNGLLAILRQKAKKHQMHYHNKLNIQENYEIKSLILNEATIWSSLIQPFGDILKAGKLTFLNFLSDLWTNIQIMTTLDPKEIEKIKSDYENKQKKFEKKWEPILKRADAGLQNPDLQVMMMLYSPTLWANKFAYNWSKDKIKKIFFDEDDAESDSTTKSKQDNKKKKSRKYYDDSYQSFKSLFENFSGANEKILLEEKESKDVLLQKFVEQNKSDLEQYNEIIVELIQNFDSRFKTIEQFSKEIEQSNNYEDLKKTIENFDFSKDPKSNIDYEELRKNILKILEDSYNKSRNELASLEQPGGKALKNAVVGSQLIKQYNLDDDQSKKFEISDDQLKKDIKKLKPIDTKTLQDAADNQFFTLVKKDIKEKLMPSLNNLKQSIAKEIQEQLPFLKNSESDLKEIFKEFPEFLNFLIDKKNYYKI